MGNRVLPQVENKIQQYQREHHGATPLYIVMPADDAENLRTEVRQAAGYEKNIIITEVNGIKIVSNPAMTPGDIQLTDELPELGS